MLRTLLIATALLVASGSSFAHGGDGYGRVIAVEPHLVISFGTPRPDGFRVLYESGGDRYWTHTSYYPGPRIVLPPPYRVEPVYYRDFGRDWDDRGWHRHRGYRDGWHDERWEQRREYRRRYDD